MDVSLVLTRFLQRKQQHSAKTMKKIVAIILCLCLCFLGYSQYSDSVQYHFGFASTGSINKTNDGNAYLLSNSLAFNTRQKEVSMNLNSSWVYGQNNGTLTNNDFFVTADADVSRHLHKIYYWALANYETNYSLKTIYRFQPGAGIGYTFYDSTKARLVVSDGILYETANLIDAVKGRNVYTTFRNSLRVKYHVEINKFIVLDGSNFWQPSLKNFSDYIFKLNNTLSFKLNKLVSLTAAATYNKISATQSENLLLTFGITLDRYF